MKIDGKAVKRYSRGYDELILPPPEEKLDVDKNANEYKFDYKIWVKEPQNFNENPLLFKGKNIRTKASDFAIINRIKTYQKNSNQNFSDNVKNGNSIDCSEFGFTPSNEIIQVKANKLQCSEWIRPMIHDRDVCIEKLEKQFENITKKISDNVCELEKIEEKNNSTRTCNIYPVVKREAKFPFLDQKPRIPIAQIPPKKLDIPPLEQGSPSSQTFLNIFVKPEPPISSATPHLERKSPYSTKKSQISVNIFMKPEPASATPPIMKLAKKLIPIPNQICRGCKKDINIWTLYSCDHYFCETCLSRFSCHFGDDKKQSKCPFCQSIKERKKLNKKRIYRKKLKRDLEETDKEKDSKKLKKRRLPKDSTTHKKDLSIFEKIKKRHLKKQATKHFLTLDASKHILKQKSSRDL